MPALSLPLPRARAWRRSPLWRKAGLRLALLLLLCAAGAFLAEQLAHQDTLTRARSETAEQLGDLRVALERALSSDVQRVRGLVAYTRDNPELDQAEFAQLAQYLLSDSEGAIRNLALARDLVISHVYPLAGNERALGLDYRRNEVQWPLVEQAIRQNDITVAGPLELVQGGIGVIARFPIFLPVIGPSDPPERGPLWGVASMAIDFPALLERVDLPRFQKDVTIVFYGRDGTGRAGAPFLGDPEALAERPVALEVQLASGSWIIEGTPHGGWPGHSDYLWEIVVAATAVLLVGLGLIAWNLRFETRLVDAAAALEQAREEAETARRTAEQANRAKTLFLSNMSHELRTPLNAIIGFTEIMEQGTFGQIGNPRYRAYVSDIYRSSRHLFELINDILDISRIESGDVAVRDGEIELDKAIGGAVHLLGSRVAEKRIALSTEIAEPAPRLRGDATLVRQVLVNIVGNALKYTPAGGAVEIAAGLAPDGAVVVRVTDSGPGIQPHLVHKALEPFVQLNRAHDVAHEGTGLGLPIAKRLMEAHGGRLSILPREPAAGGRDGSGGTSIVLEFPAERTLPAAAAVSALPGAAD